MSTVVSDHIQCPQCAAELGQIDGARPSFCQQCRFPVMLVAGKYQLVKILGEGGFGTVYEARHIHLNRDPRRVVKVLKPELLQAETMRERFAREVQVTSALSQRNHHIVRVYDDFGEIPNFGLFYVMEHLEGKPLSSLLEYNEELLPLDLCYHFFEQLCMAMQDAHEEGIIHRDLKPDNMLVVKHLRDDKHLKVIDFGIARPTEPNKKLTNFSQGMLGTPAYMAPEQLSQKIGEHVDIYAMGVILFELLVGHTPFAYIDGSTRTPAELIAAKLMETPPRVDQAAPEGRNISEAMVDVVATALARDVNQRFATVEALERAFKQARHEPLIPDFPGGITLDDPTFDDPSQTQDILGSHTPEHEEPSESINMFATLPYALDLDELQFDKTPAVALRPAISDEGLPFSPEPANTLRGEDPTRQAPQTPSPATGRRYVDAAEEDTPPPKADATEANDDTQEPTTPPKTPTPAKEQPKQPATTPPQTPSPATKAESDQPIAVITKPKPKHKAPKKEEEEAILVLSPEKRITPPQEQEAPPLTPVPKQRANTPNRLEADKQSWHSLQSVDIDPDMFPEDDGGLSGKSIHSQRTETKKRVLVLILLLLTLGLALYMGVETIRQEGLITRRPNVKKRIQPIKAGMGTEPIPTPPRKATTKRPRPRPRRRKPKPRKPKRRGMSRTTRYCPKDSSKIWLRLQFSGNVARTLKVKTSSKARIIPDKKGFCIGSRSGKGNVSVLARRRGSYMACSFPFLKYRPYRVLTMKRSKKGLSPPADYCAK